MQIYYLEIVTKEVDAVCDAYSRKVIYLWGPSGELWHVTELNCDEQ